MYPKKILHFSFWLLISLTFCTPLIFVLNSKINDQSLKTTIFFSVSLLLFIGIIHFVNFRRKIILNYKIRPFNGIYFLFFILIIWILQTLIFPPFFYSFYSKQIFSPSLYLLIGSLILAPVLEEIIFRNILLNSLLNSYSRNKAIVISSLLFAIIHITPIQIAQTFVIGLFFGIIYSKNKNIAYTILLHSLSNLFVFLVQFFLDYFSNLYFLVMMYMINFIIAVFLLVYFSKKYDCSVSKLIQLTKITNPKNDVRNF